ncbi:MAG: SIR2 family protein [Pseudomonadota bacterium]
MRNYYYTVDAKFVANRLDECRRHELPPVVLVGAGISVGAGGPTGPGLIQAIIRKYPIDEDDRRAIAVKTVLERKDLSKVGRVSLASAAVDVTAGPAYYTTGRDKAVAALWKNSGGKGDAPVAAWELYDTIAGDIYSHLIATASRRELYAIFADYLMFNMPGRGYDRFARLCKKGYFDWIFTTNFDPLVEHALASVGVRSWQYMHVAREFSAPDLLAGFIRAAHPQPSSKIVSLAADSSPLVNLIKLHGDLKLREVDATIASITDFRDDEKVLFDALVEFIRSRDLIVIGHALRDDAIKKVLLAAFERGSKGRHQVTVVTMSEEEVANSQILRQLAEEKRAHVRYLPFPKGGDRFDAQMERIYAEVRAIEGKASGRSRRLTDFDRLLHLSGMTPNKRQLVEHCVAPGYVQDIGELYEGRRGGNSEEAKAAQNTFLTERAPPIFFSSLGDSATAHLLADGLRRGGSSTELFPGLSDFPFFENEFMPGLWMGYGGKAAEDIFGLKASSPPPPLAEVLSRHEWPAYGIKGVSARLFLLWAMRARQARDRKQSDDHLIVHCRGKKLDQLETVALLAGGRNHMRLTRNEKEAHVVLSDDSAPDMVALPMARFVLTPGPTTTFGQTLAYGAGAKAVAGGPDAIDIDNECVVTVGGPEHHKGLELFIALHRWGGGRLVFSASNYFDRAESVGGDDIRALLNLAGVSSTSFDSAGSTLVLNTEDFVGGVLRRTVGGGAESTRWLRGSRDSFLASFTVPRTLDMGNPADTDPDGCLKVLAVVGMSMIGTMFGSAYVAWSDIKLGAGEQRIVHLEVPNEISHRQSLRSAMAEFSGFLSGDNKGKPLIKGLPQPSRSLQRMLMDPVPAAMLAHLEKIGETDLALKARNRPNAALFAMLADRAGLVRAP